MMRSLRNSGQGYLKDRPIKKKIRLEKGGDGEVEAGEKAEVRKGKGNLGLSGGQSRVGVAVATSKKQSDGEKKGPRRRDMARGRDGGGKPCMKELKKGTFESRSKTKRVGETNLKKSSRARGVSEKGNVIAVRGVSRPYGIEQGSGAGRSLPKEMEWEGEESAWSVEGIFAAEGNEERMVYSGEDPGGGQLHGKGRSRPILGQVVWEFRAHQTEKSLPWEGKESP